MKVQCVGDIYNIECPSCGKINNYVAQGVKVTFGKISLFEKPCFHCKKKIYYRAEYKLEITASESSILEAVAKVCLK